MYMGGLEGGFLKSWQRFFPLTCQLYAILFVFDSGNIVMMLKTTRSFMFHSKINFLLVQPELFSEYQLIMRASLLTFQVDLSTLIIDSKKGP